MNDFYELFPDGSQEEINWEELGVKPTEEEILRKQASSLSNDPYLEYGLIERG